MARQPRHALAARIVSRIDQLAAITGGQEGAVARQYLSAEHKAASDMIGRWMSELGLEVHVDAFGTLIGRLEGSGRGARTLLVGANIYTGPNGGQFDGVLGALVAIEALAEMRRLGRTMACAVEILVFSNDAGARFGQPAIGARGISGALEEGWADVVDRSGKRLADALLEFGAEAGSAGGAVRSSADLLAYIEVQAEQRPVLEKEGAGVGVVTTVGGSTRLCVEVHGRSGHNGAWPMQGRRDALAGAAELVLSVERVARETASLNATVGNVVMEEAAGALIPGFVKFAIDARSPLDGARRTGLREMERLFKGIARLRQLTVKLTEVHNEKAAACDARLTRLFSATADSLGAAAIGMPNCAGENALAISRICPIGMLLIRSKPGNASWSDEVVRTEDIETATRVLIESLSNLTQNGRTIV